MSNPVFFSIDDQRGQMKMASGKRIFLINLLITLAFLVGSRSGAAASLQSYHIDPNSISVSGVSSGGYMAQQFHVAHSATVMGVGVVAGGPYRCAGSGYPFNVWRATNVCMDLDDWVMFFGPPDPSVSIQATHAEASNGRIDDPANLNIDRVYLFSGTKDKTVPQSVMSTLLAYYREFVAMHNVLNVDDLPAGHAFVTEEFGNPVCDTTGSPYINDCDYDMAGELLKHIYSALLPPSAWRPASLLEFEQSEFIGDPASYSLDPTGYVYVPAACEDGARCRLHIAFHGCRQYPALIGDAFYAHAGYNQWAEANEIIVLYPQTVPKRYFGMAWPNPRGCWDWWGYTGANYHVKSGAQIKAVKAMIDRITGLGTQ